MSNVTVTRDKKDPTQLNVTIYYTPIFPMKPYVKRPYNKIDCRNFTCKADGTTWRACSSVKYKNSRGTPITLSGNESKTYRYISYYELRKYYV